MDGGMIGNGSKVGYRLLSDDSPLGTYTRVGQLMDAEGLNLEADAVDSDVHSAYRYKRMMPGKISVAPLVLKLLANPDELDGEGVNQEALFDLLESGETVEWRIEVPTDRQQTQFKGRVFNGWVKSFDESQGRTEGQYTSVGIQFDANTFTRTAAGPSLIT